MEVQRSSFATEDPLRAREFIDRTYGAKIRVRADRPVDVSVDFAEVEVGGVSVAEMGSAFQLDFDLAGQGRYVFSTLLEGTAEHRGPDGTQRFGRGDTFIAMQAHGEERARARARTRLVSFPGPLLETTARPRPEDRGPAWRFLSQRPLADGARRWQEAIDFFDGVLADPDTRDEPLVVAPATRLLAAVALTAFPNDAVPPPTGTEGRDARPETLRRAIAFIEGDPARDITVGDIAGAASVSTRTIQLAFRRHLDTTPTAYLRKVRLAEAQRRLQAASPGDGTTVVRVAAEWGFARSDRFAAHYRAAYGRSPGETLGE